MVPRPSARRRQSSFSSARSAAMHAGADSDEDGAFELEVDDAEPMGGSDFESSDLPSPVPVCDHCTDFTECLQ
jgi:hypothetical protein